MAKLSILMMKESGIMMHVVLAIRLFSHKLQLVKRAANATKQYQQYTQDICLLKFCDDTGECTFVMFEKETARLLKQSAAETMDKILKAGGMKEDIPDVLGQFLNVDFLFKITVDAVRNVRKKKTEFHVVKMTNEASTIANSLSSQHQGMMLLIRLTKATRNAWMPKIRRIVPK